MNHRIHVFFSGIVQGVGFRYTAKQIAIDLDITGWVRNLSDGQVEVVAEGTRQELEDFLSQTNKYFDRYIHNKKIEWLRATGEFRNFGIKF